MAALVRALARTWLVLVVVLTLVAGRAAARRSIARQFSFTGGATSVTYCSVLRLGIKCWYSLCAYSIHPQVIVSSLMLLQLRMTASPSIKV
jgi:hypothetical protein